jgi:C-methyltransferase C-terminal domain/Putative zinc binding domain/Methyltransferase domain
MAMKVVERAQALEATGPCCRSCGALLRQTFVDLGMSPLCETFPAAAALKDMEPFYPLHVYVCERCFLVQLEEFVAPEAIFSEYPYFSSYSDSWLDHARNYASEMMVRFKLGPQDRVIEVGSNDGYLLQYFLRSGVPALGIEPARNVAQAAIQQGIPTRVEFFGEESARRLRAEGLGADLLVGNNVLAQVPGLNDFVSGLKLLLNEGGVITLEFPHLVRLAEGNQFDTIYHEHFSYFSLLSLEPVLERHGLEVCDVEELPTHGGSLRVYARHAGERPAPTPRVASLRAQEEAVGLHQLQYYSSFGLKVEETKRKLLRFLIDAKEAGSSVAGYGAPGKGNTLLNYCGIRTDLLDYTVDRNPHKQGRFLPGTHIPIFHPDHLFETRPDYVLILPWNLREEIMTQLADIRQWGGRFVVPIPEARVHP